MAVTTPVRIREGTFLSSITNTIIFYYGETIWQNIARQCVREVKELDLKSNGLCPRGFEPRRCRFSIQTTRLMQKEMENLGIDPSASRMLSERSTI